MKKKLLFLFVLFLFNIIITSANAWTNICPNPDYSYCYYCNMVGKDAYNAYNDYGPTDVKLGKIIGIAWRTKGSLISYSGHVSPRDAFYCIIDDGWGKPFLRQCREIEPR